VLKSTYRKLAAQSIPNRPWDHHRSTKEASYCEHWCKERTKESHCHQGLQANWRYKEEGCSCKEASCQGERCTCDLILINLANTIHRQRLLLRRPRMLLKRRYAAHLLCCCDALRRVNHPCLKCNIPKCLTKFARNFTLPSNTKNLILYLLHVLICFLPLSSRSISSYEAIPCCFAIFSWHFPPPGCSSKED